MVVMNSSILIILFMGTVVGAVKVTTPGPSHKVITDNKPYSVTAPRCLGDRNCQTEQIGRKLSDLNKNRSENDNITRKYDNKPFKNLKKLKKQGTSKSGSKEISIGDAMSSFRTKEPTQTTLPYEVAKKIKQKKHHSISTTTEPSFYNVRQRHPLPKDIPKIVRDSFNHKSNESNKSPLFPSGSKKLSLTHSIMIFSVLFFIAGVFLTFCFAFLIVERHRQKKRELLDDSTNADGNNIEDEQDEAAENANVMDEHIDLLPLPNANETIVDVKVHVENESDHQKEHLSEIDQILSIPSLLHKNDLEPSSNKGKSSNKHIEKHKKQKGKYNYPFTSSHSSKSPIPQSAKTDLNAKRKLPQDIEVLTQEDESGYIGEFSKPDKSDCIYHREDIEEGAVGGITDQRASSSWVTFEDPDSRKSSSSSSESDYYLHIDDSRYNLINKRQWPQRPVPSTVKQTRQKQPKEKKEKQWRGRKPGGSSLKEMRHRKISPPKHEKLLIRLEKILGSELIKRVRKLSTELLYPGIPEEPMPIVEVRRKDSGVADLEDAHTVTDREGKYSDSDDMQVNHKCFDDIR